MHIVVNLTQVLRLPLLAMVMAYSLYLGNTYLEF